MVLVQAHMGVSVQLSVVSQSLTDYRYKLFSARALQSNSAALWLYERMCASLPTGAAEGCGDRVMWKGSWSFIGSTWTWSLVWSFTEVMCARRARLAAEGGAELPFDGRRRGGCGSRGREMTRATPFWVVTAMARIQNVLKGLHIRRSGVPARMSASTRASGPILPKMVVFTVSTKAQ